jgi:hypothetical protein
VEIYESATGKQPDRGARMARYSGVRRLLFSADGDRLLIAFRDYLYELRPASKGQDRERALWSWETNRAKEDRWVVAADFSADGRRTALFTTTTKKLRAPAEPWESPRLLLVDNASGKILQTLDAGAAPVALSPDGRLLAAGGGTGGLKVWRLE